MAASNAVGSVLDVGCGTGRNLLPFADCSQLVHGFDLDPVSVTIVKERVPGASVWVGDVLSTKIHRSYDFVICHGLLHFLTANERRDAYEKLQLWTKDGGLISLVSFNSRTPIPADLVPLIPDPPDDSDEILDAFSEWQKLVFESYTFQDVHSGNIEHTHTVDRLLAVKKK